MAYGLWYLAMLACRPAELPVEPAVVPSSGYVDVRFDVAAAGLDPQGVQQVVVGGLPVYALRVDGDAVVATVQGAPLPGPTTVEIVDVLGAHAFDEAIEYEPPIDPLFDRMLGIGASLTGGVQGGVPTQHGQLHSPGRVIAEQAGAFYALPLLVDPLFPSIGPQDVGPAPECVVPDVVSFVASAAIDVLTLLNDPVADRIDFELALETPEVMPSNLAVGSSKVDTVLHGPDDGDFVRTFLAKLVYDTDLDLSDPVEHSQLDLVRQSAPTLIVSMDIYGNDLLTSLVESAVVEPELLTPADQMDEQLGELVDALAQTGAEVFLTNMPHVTLLPITEEKRQAAIAAAVAAAAGSGGDVDAAAVEEEEAVDARIAEVDAMADTYNAQLDAHAARHANVHVVDFAGKVAEVEVEPLEVDGQVLTIGKLGGLLSTDGIHFSDAGYAMLGNLVLEAIESELGVVVPQADMGAVVAGDPYALGALRQAGVEPDDCD